MSSLPYAQLCRQFSLDEILSATQNFDDALVVGKGGFGNVYKGTITIDNGETFIVAIKRLNIDSSQGATEFQAEIKTLTKLRHCNLVSLIGYCNEDSEMILIYEFMPHGTLDDHLHKKGTSLSWVQRLKISIGAARGLHYLHTGTGTQLGVIHRDVKSTNILLDEDYVAKISDFGLAKIGPTNASGAYVKTGVKGTFGYLDPEYFYTGRLTWKSDVYAFGVVLFELLCGRVAVLDKDLEEINEISLAMWALDSIKNRKVHKIIDLKIRSQIDRKCLKEFVQIARRCLSSESEKRPKMAEIVVALERSLSLQNEYGTTVKPDMPAVGISSIGRMIKWPFNSGQSDTHPSTIEDSLDHGSSSKEDRSTNIPGVSSRTGSTDGNDNGNSNGNNPPIPRSEGEILQSCNLKSFNYSDLRMATGNFRCDAKLGEGGYGSVYKGWIDEQSFAASELGTGVVVAVKRLRLDIVLRHKDQAWLAEVNYLGQFSHPNLVNLIGYCLEKEHRLLVYEFMQQGSLENHLFRKGSYFQPLSWSLRLKVALGAAKGLAFLHGVDTKVNFRYFKTSNVLLDSDYNAKLSFIEEAKDWPTCDESYVPTLLTNPIVSPNVYIAPEYVATGHWSTKSDVYSFGAVLIEMLSGRRAIDENRPKGEQNLIAWAKPYLPHKRKLFRVLDNCLEGQYTLDVAHATANLALRCVSMNPRFRPSMAEVVKELELLQDPKR